MAVGPGWHEKFARLTVKWKAGDFYATRYIQWTTIRIQNVPISGYCGQKSLVIGVKHLGFAARN